MNIAIIGTGYVGLVSGVCLASKGHNVICVDLNTEIVKKLNKGKTTIYEKNLDFLLKKTIAEKKFSATTNLVEALNFSNLIIVAVGTPQKNGSINLKYIKKVCQDIGNYMLNNNKYITVIIKSTVIPGTTDTFVRKEIEKYSKKKIGTFGLGMNPEFLREGNAVEDFLNPDRIVIGYETKKTLMMMKKLYAPWKVDKLYVNTRTAELIKYANNILLATQISTLNEIANLSSSLGNIDITQVVKGVHLDKRWNPIINNKRSNPGILNYLIPGCGFGGSCFPKDLSALKEQARKHRIQMRVINAVLDVNENQPYQVIKMLESEIGSISKKKVLILGLSFNPETDDVRNSPAIKICNQLIKKNALVSAHDPKAIKNFKINNVKISSKINFVNNWKTKIKKNDIIIITTPWKDYLSLTNFNLNGKIVFDGKKAFSVKAFDHAKYLSIGLRFEN